MNNIEIDTNIKNVSNIEIVSNNHPRPLLCYLDLTEKERSEYDYDGAEEAEFFRYKGNAYSMDDFVVSTGVLSERGWHGMSPDSFFSGIVVSMITDDTDNVIVGFYCC